MNKLTLLFAVSVYLATTSHAAAQRPVDILRGASIVAQDGKKTFLGKIEGKFGTNSIFNQFSNYGSKFSSTSIFNQFSNFGGKFGNHSPFNKFVTKPPMIIKNGRVIGYLTVNKFVRGAISPAILQAIKNDL